MAVLTGRDAADWLEGNQLPELREGEPVRVAGHRETFTVRRVRVSLTGSVSVCVRDTGKNAFQRDTYVPPDLVTPALPAAGRAVLPPVPIHVLEKPPPPAAFVPSERPSTTLPRRRKK